MKNSILLIIYLIIQLDCASNSNPSKVYITNSCDEIYYPVSFKSIRDSLDFYNEKYVEISGYYHSAFEHSAISMKKNSTNTKNMIWTDFTFSIVDSLERNTPAGKGIGDMLNNKKIKIRGILKAESKGHLGGYLTAIQYVCYLEIYNP